MQHCKLNTLVTFPVSGLDISRHSRRPNLPSSSQPRDGAASKLPSSPWLTWKPGRKAPELPDDLIYDLYAVCNHYGNMQGGHYTGWCFICIFLRYFVEKTKNLHFGSVLSEVLCLYDNWKLHDESSPCGDRNTWSSIGMYRAPVVSGTGWISDHFSLFPSNSGSGS